MLDSRLACALAAIDAVNSEDPNRLSVDGGEPRPKELVHSEMATRWVERLRPDASDELRIATRAHHIKRWSVPRSNYPEGRVGYLKWRTELKKLHAAEAARIATECGYPTETAERVGEIIRRADLKGDADAQTLEDALCLVFLETQFHEIAVRFDEPKVIDIVRKTLRKMSDAGKGAALEMDLAGEDRVLIEKAAS